MEMEWSKQKPNSKGIWEYCPTAGSDASFYMVYEMERIGWVAQLITWGGNPASAQHVNDMPGYWLKKERAEPPVHAPELPRPMVYLIGRDCSVLGARFALSFGGHCIATTAEGSPCWATSLSYLKSICTLTEVV
jgi:hypothetical protein